MKTLTFSEAVEFARDAFANGDDDQIFFVNKTGFEKGVVMCFERSYSISSDSMGVGVHAFEIMPIGGVVAICVNPDIQGLYKLSHDRLYTMLVRISGSHEVASEAYAKITRGNDFPDEGSEDLDEDDSGDINSSHISVDTQVVDGEYGKFFRTIVKHDDFDAVGLGRTREMSEIIAYRNLADALKESVND